MRKSLLRPEFAKFPVNFPVSREFGAETSSQLTASSATQSGLHQLRCEPGTRSFDMSDGHQKAPRPTWLLDRGCPDSLFQHACAPGDLRHDRAGIAPQIPC